MRREAQAEAGGANIPLTDMHSHVLPGVDDGAADMEESLAMMEAAYAQGVRSMIATPHWRPGHGAEKRAALEAAWREAEARMRGRHGDFRLLLGCEAYWSGSAAEELLASLRAGTAPTLAGGGCALVEAPPWTPLEELASMARRLTEAGLCPVLAHVERYGCLRKGREALKALTGQGASLQINAEPLLGWMPSSARKLLIGALEEGLAHFVGSDCHGARDRRPNLGAAAEAMRRRLSPRAWERVFQGNPGRLLEGRWP